MRKLYILFCSMVSLLLVFREATTFADPRSRTLRSLVLRPDTEVSDVPLNAVCDVKASVRPSAATVRTISGRTVISGKTISARTNLVGYESAQLELSSAGDAVLPKLSSLGAEQEESIVQVNGGYVNCTFRVFITRPDWFEEATKAFSTYGEGLKGVGESWFVYDPVAHAEEAFVKDKEKRQRAEKEVEREQRSMGGTVPSTTTFAATSTSDEGTEAILTDDFGVINTRGVCTRFYDPTGLTKSGYGMVKWNSNPAGAGFSYKHEFDYEPPKMRCPAGPYLWNNYVDGVYKLEWQFVAHKIPNHCTGRREIIGGKAAWVCCCTKAYTYLFGICNWIDTRTLLDWPDAGKRCY